LQVFFINTCKPYQLKAKYTSSNIKIKKNVKIILISDNDALQGLREREKEEKNISGVNSVVFIIEK
jgi:hypothetical protein